MQRCLSSVLLSRGVLLYFIFFFTCSDTLFASYYRIFPEGCESDNAKVVFIRTGKQLDANWLLENAHLNVQEVSFHAIEASNAAYFIFNGGIGHRGLNFAEYSSHLVSAIRAVFLIMADSRFHPPARSVASEPPRVDQRDFFIAVDQLEQLAWLLNSIGQLADRLQGEGAIADWHFIRLVFHDEGRVAVRIRVSSQDHELVLQRFREHFPFRTIAIQRPQIDSASGTQSFPPINTNQRRNRFDILEVGVESVNLIRGLLAANNLLSFETINIPDRTTYQSFIVRFNVRREDLQRIADPEWLDNVRSFLRWLDVDTSTGNVRPFSGYLARIDGSHYQANGIALTLSFRFIIYTGRNNQESVTPSDLLGQTGVSDARPWDSLQIRWHYPVRQTVVQPVCFAGILLRVLRLLSRRNHAENGNPAETVRLLTNPNRDASHTHFIQLPGSSRTN
ncbi:hypothetical protein [Endozoicomonas lisbonensis]|uniref:Uncharacterized protein n=1 Tax=Endozoicomonas lisbonensis TaxID=3120522 RepID=A0ABV2SIN9_9GAMM